MANKILANINVKVVMLVPTKDKDREITEKMINGIEADLERALEDFLDFDDKYCDTNESFVCVKVEVE